MYRRTGKVLLFLAILLCQSIPGVAAQVLDDALEEELQTHSVIAEFSVKPSSLLLLPRYEGFRDFQDRHIQLKPHVVQELLFALAPNRIAIDHQLVYQILLETPSLSGLRYNRKNAAPFLLFRDVRFLEVPTPEDFSCIVEVEDRDFGTIRFKLEAEYRNNRLELHLINLNTLYYFVLPVVPPEKALIDLVYYGGSERSLVYTAWSIGTYFFLPSIRSMRPPLFRRAMAFKDWFVDLLEQYGI